MVNKKLIKLLWKIHWCVNIAPNFNGVISKSIKPYKIKEESFNLPTGEGNWFWVYNYTAIGWRIFGKAPYSLNLVEERQKLIKRYARIT